MTTAIVSAPDQRAEREIDICLFNKKRSSGRETETQLGINPDLKALGPEGDDNASRRGYCTNSEAPDFEDDDGDERGVEEPGSLHQGTVEDIANSPFRERGVSRMGQPQLGRSNETSNSSYGVERSGNHYRRGISLSSELSSVSMKNSTAVGGTHLAARGQQGRRSIADRSTPATEWRYA